MRCAVCSGIRILYKKGLARGLCIEVDAAPAQSGYVCRVQSTPPPVDLPVPQGPWE